MNISSEKTDLKKTYLAIVTMLLAILCVDMYMVVIKFLGNEYTVIQLAVFRNLNNKIIVLSFFRGLAFLSMNIFIFISVINLEFATAMVLTFSSPFFIVILSIIFLKDKVGIYRWSAIFIGFFGVVLIVQPGSDIFSFYSIFPILTAIAWALSVIILKFIPDGHSTAKIQLYTLIFNVIGGVVLFLLTTGHGEIKSTQDFFLMTLTGILGGTAAILFIYSYRLISASKMASFEYFGIPSSFVLGWLFFNEAPWEQLFPGVFVIVFAGMIIIWRDKVKQKKTKVSREIN